MNPKLASILRHSAGAALGAVAAIFLAPDIDWGETQPWTQAALTILARLALFLVPLINGKAAAVLLAGILAFSAGPARASNLASDWSVGPTVPFWRYDLGTNTSAMLDAGAGLSINRNLLSNESGSIKQLTVGLPFFVRSASGDPATFGLSAGLTLGTLNNLFAIGFAADIVEAAESTAPGGFFDGVGREDFALIFSVGFNLGNGKPAPMVGVRRAASKLGVADRSPPPNYWKPW